MSKLSRVPGGSYGAVLEVAAAALDLPATGRVQFRGETGADRGVRTLVVRSLSVGFPHAFVDDLRGMMLSHIWTGLANVPPDITLEDLSRTDFDRLLGPNSPAWQLWVDLAASLRRLKPERL
jgi:hypothetical protein